MKRIKNGIKGGIALAILISAYLFIQTPAQASQTMDLVDEYRDGSKKVCVYSDGRNSAEVRKSLAGSCPSKHIEY